MNQNRNRGRNTSWQKVAPWYNKLVRDEGHFFHQHLVIPRSLALLALKKGDSLLDLGSGQGVLARSIQREVYYQGLDISPALISYAANSDRNPLHHFTVSDVTKPLVIEKKDFSHAAFILSLQNIEFPDQAISSVGNHLKPGGKLLIVLNHPMFRIPRQTSWGIDEAKKTQYRKVEIYNSALKIPINMHPGQRDSPVTWSFHFPLSSYSQWLYESGFIIEKIEEWSSGKSSVGRAAKMENRSRNEIPLFMAILVRKYGKERI
ncbi:MAG: hypothetical protein UT63_C0004G0021 [Candidatus Gottesmanbacteria bacterium GW2011_GWC2_39_8]|uniref:Uncharacterized protein n=1 Tax=Candidatus Gottesmanbacteria bacterium GW2011_GWC2_39_8 TaxID=1618450 RepID=A0A0G0Q1J8_9BACT|nr:MAG: hypothetical protein UT63_C0004G0021 [Candidatus Gottesmanbacteria bacterium GW2011_GWC2_39_8]